MLKNPDKRPSKRNHGPPNSRNGQGWVTKLAADAKASATKRGYSWDLTWEQVRDLSLSPCHYCGIPPCLERMKRQYPGVLMNGIDRFDNALGYSIENVVPCCRVCNIAKAQYSKEEFLARVARIVEVCGE